MRRFASGRPMRPRLPAHRHRWGDPRRRGDAGDRQRPL